MKQGSVTSIKATLKNVADTSNTKFQNITTRYFQERLLYRISNSKYSTNFILKGGALIYAFEGVRSRPTVDVDMSAKQVNNDKEQIKQIFQEICRVEYHDDCVIFDVKSIEATDIVEDAKYSGIRVWIDASLDTIKHRLQIDLGFGDVITPAPIDLTYPVLLERLAPPQIKAYSIETVIAEKFQAMIQLGGFNSRMKDFYDIYTLLNNNDIDNGNLKEAILQTFKNRNTGFVKNHELFADSFHENQNRRKIWQSFLRKANVDGSLEFAHVTKRIFETLQPVYDGFIREI